MRRPSTNWPKPNLSHIKRRHAKTNKKKLPKEKTFCFSLLGETDGGAFRQNAQKHKSKSPIITLVDVNIFMWQKEFLICLRANIIL